MDQIKTFGIVFSLLFTMIMYQGCHHAGKAIKPIVLRLGKSIDEVKPKELVHLDPALLKMESQTNAEIQKNLEDWAQENLEMLSDHLDKLPDLYELVNEGQWVRYREANILVTEFLKMKIITTYSKMNYEKTDDYRFDLVEKISKGTTETWHNNSKSVLETWTDVELPQSNEFDYYELDEINEQGAKFKVQTRINQEGISIDFNYDMETEYVLGSYQDYISGRVITLEQTSSSKEKMESYLKNLIENTLTNKIKSQLILSAKQNFSSEEFSQFITKTKLFVESNADVMDASVTRLKLTDQKIEELMTGEFVLNFDMKSYIVAL